MLKIKRIKVSGFRGILQEKELNFVENRKTPSSLALFGLNSTGKSSFIDGLEWFLSPYHEIEWLKRENAGWKAYPHQDVKEKETSVEIEFDDDKNKLKILKKTFNSKRITTPTLSSNTDFDDLYSSFIVKPFLRYQEVIEFVFNSSGVEKYQRLSKWMGFEDELKFQEKIALKIIPNIKNRERDLSLKIETKENEITQLSGLTSFTEQESLDYCNGQLKTIKLGPYKDLKEAETAVAIPKTGPSKEEEKIFILINSQTTIPIVSLNKDLPQAISEIDKKISKIKEVKENFVKINYLELYEHAIKILDGSSEKLTTCPVCGNEWDREKLIKEVRTKFEGISEFKKNKEALSVLIDKCVTLIENEISQLNELIKLYGNSAKAGAITTDLKVVKYKNDLSNILIILKTKPFELDLTKFDLHKAFNELDKEKQDNLEIIKKELEKLGAKGPSEGQTKEKIRKTIELWRQRESLSNALNFYSKQTEIFINVCDQLSKKIQDNITGRFNKISTTIESFFKILRSDKDIKDIKLELNTDTEKAVGRSAEIKLSYFDLEVKPAYKVLSESLLNSLGLAVYFTCVKEFNKDCGFIALDDVMNSLDKGHRDTLLSLIEQEFNDYQIIVFTHDDFWFQKIQANFPSWEIKKIKDWDYFKGPSIDKNLSALTEVDELLKDNTKARDAGYKLSLYIEDILHELCENFEAEIKYRYFRNNPPMMDELINALLKRAEKLKLSNTTLMDAIKALKKNEPILRNFSDHSKNNLASSISPTEVEKVKNEWINLEKMLRCQECNKYVSFAYSARLECKCGKLKIS